MVLSREVDSQVLKMLIQFEYFFQYVGKMVDVMLKLLDGFSLVWVLIYWHSKFAFLQVTLNFESEETNITSGHSNSNFAHSFDFNCLTDFAKNIDLS